MDNRVTWEVMGTYRLRAFDWETSVSSDKDNVIYYFRGLTKAGSRKVAERFIQEQLG